MRSLQEEYHAEEEKFNMCFVDQEKALDRVLKNVFEWAMRKKGIPEVLVRSVMCLNKGANTESEWILSCQRSLRL